MQQKNLISFSKDLLRAAKLVWRADKKIAIINIILQATMAFLPIASLYFIKLLIESITTESVSFNNIIPIIIAFGLVQLLLAICSQYVSYLNSIHQQKLSDYLSSEVLNKATAVDYEYYENPSYHDTLHLAQQQSLYKATALLSNFNSFLLNSLSLLFLLGFFFTLNFMFALLFMLLSIPLAIIKWYSGYALLRLERKFAPIEREASYLHQILTGISYAKEVRVFGYGQSFIKKFKTIRSYIHTERQKLLVKLNVYSLIAETIEILSMVFIFGLLAKYTWEKTLTVGTFVIYINGFQKLQSTSKNFLQALVQIFQQRIFLKDLYSFLDIPTGSSAQNTKPFPIIEKGLSIENISFTYPQTDREALQNVSFKCPAGKIIAIVGENGSGKTTLVKLLCRLYSIQSGSIKLDGNDLNSINNDSFRNNSIFLFQDFEKYFFSIEENISLGEEINELEELENAAKLSGAHVFISKFDKGYKTRMGRLFKGSEQLSGGQWQKLALARIFYKNKAKLIVLDEPTSAIDSLAEFEIFENIKEYAKDKMVILITHRLYNLKLADFIYVMKEGKIVEEGTFNFLMAQNGTFNEMFDIQKVV